LHVVRDDDAIPDAVADAHDQRRIASTEHQRRALHRRCRIEKRIGRADLDAGHCQRVSLDDLGKFEAHDVAPHHAAGCKPASKTVRQLVQRPKIGVLSFAHEGHGFR
jgi:hypothetical protein